MMQPPLKQGPRASPKINQALTKNVLVFSDCPAICPTLYDPVCGTNGVKYDNLCELKDADCKDEATDIKYDPTGTCITE